MLYYNMDLFITLENEKGDLIELCLPIAGGNVTNHSLGLVVSEPQYQAIELYGYAIQSKYSQVAIDEANYQTGDYKVYLNSRTFNPEMLKPDAYIGVNKRYYDLEIIEPIYNRGVAVYYVGTVRENDKTKTHLNIIERIKIERRYYSR